MNTRNKSYSQSAAQISERAEQIFKLLKNDGPQSRRQLAQKIGVESNSVTAAVAQLIRERRIVELDETTFDHETQREQHLLALAEGNTAPVRQKLTPKQKVAMLENKLSVAVALIKFIASRDDDFNALAAEFKKIQAART